ncbi:MAG: MATE family efflux transporter [Ruminiclostridium sp.]|nr:MATE family efflux transporter [Ruminiclostridium sp.]
MNGYTRSMISGNELGCIVRFTLPLLFGNIFQQLYNIVDSVVVGQYLGANALASVGATGSIIFLFNTMFIGVSIGTGILIAQHFGAGNEEYVKKLIANSAYSIASISILITFLSITFAPELLKLLETPETIIDGSVRYMRIVCSGTIAMAAYNWINSVMRSLGNSTVPLVFLIISSGINVGLDLLFVMVFEMEVSGAALATVLSQGISAVGCIIFAFVKFPQFKIGKNNAALDIKAVKNCISKGIPIALQNAFISLSMIYLQRTANIFGDTVVATYTATMRVEQLIHQPFMSLGTALSTFVGQNLGAGLLERCVKGYRKSMLLMTVFSIVMLGVFLLFSGTIVSFFVNEPEVIAIGETALKINACMYIALGTIYVTRGLLNGAGDVGYSMLNGFFEVLGRIGFATLLVSIPMVGCWAVWITTGLTWFITAVMSIFRYKSGKWKHHSISTTENKE